MYIISTELLEIYWLITQCKTPLKPTTFTIRKNHTHLAALIIIFFGESDTNKSQTQVVINNKLATQVAGRHSDRIVNLEFVSYRELGKTC